MNTIFIIFWATWDLAKRKLFPALYNIYRKEKKEDIDIIAVWRRDFDNKSFKEYIKEKTLNFIEHKKHFDDFLEKIKYSKVEIGNNYDYINLKDKIKQLSKENTQVIIYLSISPDNFIPFIDNSKNLDLPKNSKIIFEKPFWKDLETAIFLNKKITEIFQEEQIYRIDHYVWKEAIQNVLAFRFSNILFEPIWNNKYINNIQITATEKIWIEDRWWYYDKSWALRDMVQNHLFQVLALIVMDPPSKLDAESISQEKLKVLHSIKIPTNDDLVFWQYIWYTDEKWVEKNSKTETFVAMKIEVSNWRCIWIPIYLKTWKNLDKKQTKIVIEFNEIPNILFKKFWNIEKNRIIIEVQPDESIDIHFNIKENWNSKEVQEVKSKFKKELYSKEAYEKLIEDVIIWDKTLFTTFDILKESWTIVNDLVNCKDNCPILYKYEPWTKWPEIANNLIEDDNKKWYV